MASGLKLVAFESIHPDTGGAHGLILTNVSNTENPIHAVESA